MKEKNEEELEHLQSVHTAEPSGLTGGQGSGFRFRSSRIKIIFFFFEFDGILGM